MSKQAFVMISKNYRCPLEVVGEPRGAGVRRSYNWLELER